MPRKRKNDMSETQVTEAPAVVKAKAARRIFDLDKFERVRKEVEYEVPSALTSIEEVQALDPAKLLLIVNAGLKRQALLEAKASIQGVNPKVVNQMVNTFRLLPPYSGMVEKAEDGSVTKDSKKKQTLAIYSFIKSNEAILQMLKDAMSTAVEEDEDEDEGGEENES